MTNDHLDHYRQYGYAVVKGVFAPDEVAELAHAFDRIYAQGLNHGRAFRHPSQADWAGRAGQCGGKYTQQYAPRRFRRD